ncbi:hypothetical protein PG985_012126 [Apiospora marii]|uniref:Uncharacterized protein n=1 Tax=Apiospora marii TaxID=335849 RepID=A0ABR1RE89_9PEZI
MTTFRSTIPKRTRDEDQHSNTTILSRDMNTVVEMDNTWDAPEPGSESQPGNTFPYYAANHPVAPNELGGDNLNVNDRGSVAYPCGLSNGAASNAWPQPGHNFMSFGPYYHDPTVHVDGYGGFIGGTDRVTSPEPFVEANAGSVPTRKSRSHRHTTEAASRAKHGKSTREKKYSTDSNMSMVVDQGSDPEFDDNDQAPKRNDRKNKVELAQGFGDGPWYPFALNEDGRNHRVSQIVSDPKLPPTSGVTKQR